MNDGMSANGYHVTKAMKGHRARFNLPGTICQCITNRLICESLIIVTLALFTGLSCHAFGREAGKGYMFRFTMGKLEITTLHKSYHAHIYNWDGTRLVASDTVRRVTIVLSKDTIVEFAGIGHVYLGHLVVVQCNKDNQNGVVTHTYQLPSLQLLRMTQGDEFVRYGHVKTIDKELNRIVVDVVTGDTFALGSVDCYRFYRWIASSLTGCLRDLYWQRDIECGANRILPDNRGFAVITGFGGSDPKNIEQQESDDQNRVYVLDPTKKDLVFVGSYMPPYNERCSFTLRNDSVFYVSELSQPKYCCHVNDFRRRFSYTTITGYVFTDVAQDEVSLQSPEGVEVFRYAKRYDHSLGAKVSYFPREIYTETWLLYNNRNRADVLLRQQDGTFALIEER